MEKFNVQPYVSSGQLETTPYSRRDYYKIWLLIGKSILHYADRSIEIDQPALIFTNPLVPYSLESGAAERKGYKCMFPDEFLKAGGGMEILRQSTLFKPGSDKVFFLDKKQLEYVKRIYADMLAEQETDYIYKYENLRNYVSLLIHLSLKEQPALKEAKHVNAATRITTMFIEQLERQFPVSSPDRELKLKKANDFARSLSIHVNHLNYAVREVTGKSPSILIAERIVNEAKALLKNTDWSVSAIAFSLGFAYPTYFNNFFKKNTGVTPLSMRK
ncbi:MAG TPA: helix-turn-helix domain-containing protein [Puia sp.]|nr:helix-turn-helix domain-containing protein [Puia sp.]